jgi:hypothetical protein
MLDAIGCDRENASAKQLNTLRSMEKRILKHLKDEGYMHTFSLLENGTVRFLRFHSSPDHNM